MSEPPGVGDVEAVYNWKDRRIADSEQRIAELETDYQRIIVEVLVCNPRPASGRADDQLEPPWEVIARVRRERNEVREALQEILASGVEHDDPRMDYITMQVDRVTLAAARAAAGEER